MSEHSFIVSRELVRNALKQSIVKKARSKNITLVEELIGYSLFAENMANAYKKDPRNIHPERKILAPEILTGLMNNHKV